MTQSAGRKVLWRYAALLMMVAVGYAAYAPYAMDGDGTAFLDLSSRLAAGNFKGAVNGYWNPGYPAVLAMARNLLHPALIAEQAMARYANVFVFGCAMLASLFFTTGLVRLRGAQGDAEESQFAVPSWSLHLLGFSLLASSLERELAVNFVRSDTLLLVFLVTAAGLLARIQAGTGSWRYAALGVAMACAALTKSFGFVPSCLLLAAIVIVGVRHRNGAGKRMIGGAVLAGIVFAALYGPYLFAVARQLHRFTIGDAARLDYCADIDGMDRFYAWYAHDYGRAKGAFVHPEQVLAEHPAVFSFAAHAEGTDPLWFDPAYWTAGPKQVFYWKGQLLQVAESGKYIVRFVLGRPESFLLLGLLVAFGARWPAKERATAWLPPVAWGLLMLGIYVPVLIQDRYLSAQLMLVMLPVCGFLRTRSGDERNMPRVASALTLLMAGVLLLQGVTTLAEERRQLQLVHEPGFGYSPEITVAAKALDGLGLQRGEKVACFGDVACTTDPTWAREAGTQILAEVRTEDGADPQTVWDAIPNPRTVTAPLKAMGLRFIVTKFANSAKKPDGWVQLGSSDYFAYPLEGGPK